jgi:hypothetical protein
MRESNLRAHDGMDTDSVVTRAVASPRRPRRGFATTIACVATIGSLLVYVGGARLLLRHVGLWIVTCEQIIRHVLGFP